MNGMNHTEEQFLQKITEIIDANLHNEQFGVPQMTHEMIISRSSRHRQKLFTRGLEALFQFQKS